MFTSKITTRILANVLFFLKRKGFAGAGLKFLVFTGTVGKTTLRDATAHALRHLNIPVESNQLAYSNELGILLTALGYSGLSLKNPRTWLTLLKKKIPQERFVCIELGADFYPDIPWFLKRFTPFAVFINGVADKSWSRDIKEISKERQHLLRAVPRSGFIFHNADDAPTTELVHRSNTSAKAISFSLYTDKRTEVFLNEWSRNVFTQPIADILNTKESIILNVGQKQITLPLSRPIFEPQVYSILAVFAFIQQISPNRVQELIQGFTDYQFSQNRLQMFKAQNGALIIKDSYKATPLCTSWFLDTANRISARKKILVITEMRPLTLNIDYFYLILAEKIKCADQVYFLGPDRYFDMLRKIHPQIQHIDKDTYAGVAKKILKESSSGDLILLKGSFRYELHKLRDMLI